MRLNYCLKVHSLPQMLQDLVRNCTSQLKRFRNPTIQFSCLLGLRLSLAKILFCRYSAACTVLGNRAYVIGGTTSATQIITDEGSSFSVTRGVELPKKLEGRSFTYDGNIFFVTRDGEIMKMESNGWKSVKTIKDEPIRTALVVTPSILFPQH